MTQTMQIFLKNGLTFGEDIFCVKSHNLRNQWVGTLSVWASKHIKIRLGTFPFPTL